MLHKLKENPDYGAVYCVRTLLYPDGRKVKFYQLERCKSGWLTRELFKKTFIQTSTICFRREALQGFFFDESLQNAQDSDAWLRLSTKIQFLFVPEIQITVRLKHNVSPRTYFSSENCNRILVLERFYFKLGGDKFVPRKMAMRKISHAYRSVAKNYYQKRCKTAAFFLYKQAIHYWSFDLRLYFDLIKAFLLNKSEDKMPDWQIPKPFSGFITSNIANSETAKCPK